jgi:hypothetical protein
MVANQALDMEILKEAAKGTWQPPSVVVARCAKSAVV